MCQPNSKLLTPPLQRHLLQFYSFGQLHSRVQRRAAWHGRRSSRSGKALLNLPLHCRQIPTFITTQPARTAQTCHFGCHAGPEHPWGRDATHSSDFQLLEAGTCSSTWASAAPPHIAPVLAMQRASHGPRAKNVGGSSLLGASFGMQIGLITCSPPVDAVFHPPVIHLASCRTHRKWAVPRQDLHCWSH